MNRAGPAAQKTLTTNGKSQKNNAPCPPGGPCGGRTGPRRRRHGLFERQQSNKARKVKSNIKVKGNNRANSHTTRSY